MISICFQGKLFNITVIQVYAPTINAKEAEVDQFYKDLQNIPEWTPKKRCPFHLKGLGCKSRNSRATWNNRQVWPLNINWSMTKANRVCQENTLVIKIPFFNNPRAHSTHEHHQMVNTEIRLTIFFAAKDGEVLYS